MNFGWLTHTQNAIRQQLRDQRLAHAILLIGHPMQGVLALQDWLVATLLCTESTVDPCGQCHSCQLNQAGHHPDVFRLEPEGKAQQIKVDAVRALNQFCQGTAQQGSAQVVSLVSGERLNIAAANALLKTLEEPPAQTFIILQSAQPGALLPTIRSRMQRMICPSPSFDQGLVWLEAQGVTSSEAKRLLKLSAGSVLQALEWAQEPSTPARLQWQNILLEHFTEPQLSLQALKVFSADEILDVMQTWLNIFNAIIRSIHAKSQAPIEALDQTEGWLGLLDIYPQFSFWQAIYDEAYQVRIQLSQVNQLNATLLLEQFWLKLAKRCLQAQSRVSA